MNLRTFINMAFMKHQTHYRKTTKSLSPCTYKGFLIFLVAGLLFVFVGYKFYVFFSGFGDDEKPQEKRVISSESVVSNDVSLSSDSLCVRSWEHQEHGIVFYISNDGQLKFSSIGEFMKLKKCSLFK